MNSVALFCVTFVCLFAGACFGMTVRRFLPELHLSRESTDTLHGTIENQYKQELAFAALGK